MDLSRYRLDEIWNSDSRTEFLTALRNGHQHENCYKCWQKENIGVRSKRQIANSEWGNFVSDQRTTPLFIDLKWGNVCNLKCRHCNPWTSSKWVNEWFEADDTYQDKKTYLLQFQTTIDSYHHNNQEKFHNIFQEWFSECQHLMLYGGEGMYVKDVFEMFQSVVVSGKSRDIEIYINSNGTIYDEKWMRILAEFKKVRMAFSIDGVRESFDYIRYGANWQSVKSNLAKYRSLPNIDFDIVTTVFSINVYDSLEILTEIYQEFQYIPSVNFVYGPLWWDIRVLPDDVKAAIIERNQSLLPSCLSQIETTIDKSRFVDRYQQIQKFLSDSVDGAVDKYNKMQRWIRSIDDTRSQRFDTTFPEYNKLLRIYTDQE